jgi:hypothetical protein
MATIFKLQFTRYYKIGNKLTMNYSVRWDIGDRPQLPFSNQFYIEAFQCGNLRASKAGVDFAWMAAIDPQVGGEG